MITTNYLLKILKISRRRLTDLQRKALPAKTIKTGRNANNLWSENEVNTLIKVNNTKKREQLEEKYKDLVKKLKEKELTIRDVERILNTDFSRALSAINWLTYRIPTLAEETRGNTIYYHIFSKEAYAK